MPSLAIDARPHRRDPHVVGQRRLEPVEQLGPRERPPIDQVVGLARVEPTRARSARGSTLARSCAACCAQLGGARLVARRLRRQLGVAAASSAGSRVTLNSGRGDDDDGERRAARAARRARCRTAGSRGSCGSRGHLPVAQQQADERRQRVEQRRRRRDAVGQRGGGPRIDRLDRRRAAAPRGCGASARRRPPAAARRRRRRHSRTRLKPAPCSRSS